jgi:hypothetical protein
MSLPSEERVQGKRISVVILALFDLHKEMFSFGCFNNCVQYLGF